MTILLPLSPRYYEIIHAWAEAKYVELLTIADHIGTQPEADTESSMNALIAEALRDEAEAARHIGQTIEALAPFLEPANWRWPRALSDVKPPR